MAHEDFKDKSGSVNDGNEEVYENEYGQVMMEYKVGKGGVNGE